MATPKCNFTEKSLDSWVQDTLAAWAKAPDSIPATGETWIQDRGGPNSTPGLYLRLRLRKEARGGAFSLADPSVRFYLLKKANGRKFTRELGDRRITSVASARDEATTLLKALTKGEDPKDRARKEKEVRELQALTLRKALEDFLDDSPDLTEGTRTQYRQALKGTFKAYADKPLTFFADVEKVREIHRTRSKVSPAKADHDLRILRLLWNWAREAVQTEDGEPVLGKNPVSAALNKGNRKAGKKGWNNVPRKESIIPRSKLPEWFRALQAVRAEEDSPRVRRASTLFLELLVLTGLRFTEAATLTFGQVDSVRGILAIPDTTSKNRRPLTRPLTRRVAEILEELRPVEAEAETYVFPGRRKNGKPLDNTRALQRDLQGRTGLWITPHDLRRVYSSAATRAGVPPLVLKRLLNHLSNAEEVTEGYVRLGLDELLDFSQTVEDQILRDAGILDSGLDAKLQEVLQGLPDDAKRKLLFQLAQDRAQGVA